MDTLGDRVIALLKKENLTQKEFATMIGVTPSALTRYLKNERQPRIEVLANMATVLRTTVDYLSVGKAPTEDFDVIYRLVARSAHTLTEQQKIQIIEAVLNQKCQF